MTDTNIANPDNGSKSAAPNRAEAEDYLREAQAFIRVLNDASDQDVAYVLNEVEGRLSEILAYLVGEGEQPETTDEPPPEIAEQIVTLKMTRTDHAILLGYLEVVGARGTQLAEVLKAGEVTEP